MIKLSNDLLLKTKGLLTLTGVPEGFDGYVLAKLILKACSPIIHIARDDRRAQEVLAAIDFFSPNTKTLYFPAWDCLPYDRCSPKNLLMGQRMAVLSELSVINSKKFVLVTTVNAIIQKILPLSIIKDFSFEIMIGKKVDPINLKKFLTLAGYRFTNKVVDLGEYSIRGGIIDLFPSGFETPLRLDFFGDVLDDIRFFDPDTQRTIGHTPDKITIVPISEVLINPKSVLKFRSKYRSEFGAPGTEDSFYNAICNQQIYQGYEHWGPFFYDKMDTLFDYLSGTIISSDNGVGTLITDRFEKIQNQFDLRSEGLMKKSRLGAVYKAIKPYYLYFSPEEWELMIENKLQIAVSPLKIELNDNITYLEGKVAKDFSFERQSLGHNLFDSVVTYILKRQKVGPVIIAAYSEGSCHRLKNLFTDCGIPNVSISEKYELASLFNEIIDTQLLESKKIILSIIIFQLEKGFEIPGLTILSEQDILGERLIRKKKYKRSLDNNLINFSDISLGDLLVHVDHGIGRFVGLKEIDAMGSPHECISLEYADSDRLFVPVENIDLLSKYGNDSGSLDRLGGAGWQSRRASAKKRIRDIAEHLIRIAAERTVRSAAILNTPEIFWQEFCAGFKFEETDDQIVAIEEVLTDLASGKPMDRLVCGDVGFGKTEIALRATFVAVSAGFQVALVVPTTLLARQHFQTFLERFNKFPFKIAQLSRFVKNSEKQMTYAEIKEGTVDIIVGTHALFSSKVSFKKLGLLVVDEEQHFGVVHKEKLKQYRSNIHVLTLTATPIPRTMQLALSGVREMSLITTPPPDRLAIRTYFMEFDPVIIREALIREYNRGGQSFFVVPRIKDIEEVRIFLEEELSDLKYLVATGQMTGNTLDKVMNAFYEGKADILLSTSIVESGLDVPNANTLIAYKADLFGLSQLYQIRGRVGRSKLRAYSYLTVEQGKKITSNGEKRLNLLAGIDSLGEGFNLASQDLDIRGSGNLLGDEQSGNIKEVGFELYQEMLRDAVSKLKTGVAVLDDIADGWSPQINLGVPVLIPSLYISDLDTRLGLYRKLAYLRTENEFEEFTEELIDRFGEFPPEVRSLLKIIQIKAKCYIAGISVLTGGVKGLAIKFYKDKFNNTEGLVSFLSNPSNRAQFRDNKILISADLVSEKKRLATAYSVISEFVHLADGNSNPPQTK